ncbi:hypothetical protein SAMN03080617_02826 [Algoriphagus alkaliphilus]|jgi:hypothetical protein|uniref:Uncharacterized protein n=1 Tax=Algoriphagus alkaliphilus TaxID=279824 RepID=A0A1G5YUU6_9BACT|nr:MULTISPECIES: hypothetical protein [Algoriphagus]MBA4301267.1 hypothetical protein [Cyclobacterium sp.]MDO8965938.1 hypothetical protein [Algoriphagus sp.]MDP2042725.1 hypothetical protein [Algoriphagus sp.]MDP3198464.1 hypothetical protein [Algoriphagus sp.]MDP3472492.1 hypothetical protein [Algoriphagus sp.]
MSDTEFDLLDELYFVQTYDFIKESLKWEDELLLETLNSLYQSGMIKCLSAPDTERFDQVDLFKEGKNLFYLATKKGLMAHNTL